MRRARLTRGTALLIGGGVLALLAGACRRRVRGYEPAPIAGIRFFAAAAPTARGDAIVIEVAGRNDGREYREVEAGGCGESLAVRVMRGARTLGWDSREWHRAAAARAARMDSLPASQRITEVCVATQSARILAPGDSGRIAVATIAVRAVLGDSLPPGRYRVTARLLGNGWAAGEIPAGEVDLGAPQR